MFINGSGSELRQKSDLQIQQESKFFSRLLSKESSMANPSSRVYYGGLPGAVPFLWESQPGTPKYDHDHDHVHDHHVLVPPLTPPPSFYSKSNKKSIIQKHSRSNLLNTLFPKKVNLKKTQLPSSLPKSLSSPLSPSVSDNSSMFRGKFSSSSSSFDSRGDEYDEVDSGSPRSTLCFGIGGRGRLRRGCYQL
ncbi:hypothetical protein UlMin_000834 [Ulmus minor]